jgi:hypothetical protein
VVGKRERERGAEEEEKYRDPNMRKNKKGKVFYSKTYVMNHPPHSFLLNIGFVSFIYLFIYLLEHHENIPSKKTNRV